jgi:DNA polymerase V
MGVHGEHLVLELNGTSCLPLELDSKVRKSIARTRTFGEDVTDIHVVEAAVANFVARAAFRLREGQQLTKRASLFLATNKHKPGYRRWSREVRFTMPTADTGVITGALINALSEIVKHPYVTQFGARQGVGEQRTESYMKYGEGAVQPTTQYGPKSAIRVSGSAREQAGAVRGVGYYRAGVMLYDFVPAIVLQTGLLGNVNVAEHVRSQARMRVIDTVNERYGKQHLYYAAEDLGNKWEPRQTLRSPRYTSKWEELPPVEIPVNFSGSAAG